MGGGGRWVLTPAVPLQGGGRLFAATKLHASRHTFLAPLAHLDRGMRHEQDRGGRGCGAHEAKREKPAKANTNLQRSLVLLEIKNVEAAVVRSGRRGDERKSHLRD